MILLLRYILAPCSKKGNSGEQIAHFIPEVGREAKRSGIILRVRRNDLEKNSGINSTLIYMRGW